MKPKRTAILHYTTPPVVGGVEAVIDAHVRMFQEAGYPVTVFTGRGTADSLAEGVDFRLIPELDSRHSEIEAITASLDQGQVPETFEPMRKMLADILRPELKSFDLVIVHNIFSKRFNLPLTAALVDLLEDHTIRDCLAWCHDFSWTSPESGRFMFPGYPWDLLKIARKEVLYITVSEHRQKELAKLLKLPRDKIDVVYNGVDPSIWFGLSSEGWELVRRLDLLAGDVILLMPLRVTRAKNIEMAEKVLSEIQALGFEPRLAVTGPPDPHNQDSLAYYQSLLALRSELGLDNQMKFVFECGPLPCDPYIISQRVAADLVRVSDIVFLPSHREGFGMPVIEAGLIGVPVVSSHHVPAAREIGGKNVYLYNRQAAPAEVARLIVQKAINSKPARFRREVRKAFTWQALFHNKIEPYLLSDA